MNDEELEWLNAPGPYIQYTYEADPRLIELIRRHGFAFDDHHWYWIPRTRKGLLREDIVKRAPLWTYPNKSVPAEKVKKHMAATPKKKRGLQHFIST